MSISISLVAVLIPLLLMGGIIGRLFREFAVTLAMTIFVSMVVSLTLTPMMASRFLRAHNETRHGRFYQWSERAFEALLHAYERGLDRALKWSKTTLLIFFATLALSVYLFVIIPKGFFPQQDNGLITAASEAAQDISFADMKRASGGTRRHRAGRSRGRQHRHVHRRRRQRAQHRPHVHYAEAPQRTRRQRPAGHRAGFGRSSRRCRAQGCSCRRPRTFGSADARPAPSSNTRFRTPISAS